MRACVACGRDARGEFCAECMKKHGGLTHNKKVALKELPHSSLDPREPWIGEGVQFKCELSGERPLGTHVDLDLELCKRIKDAKLIKRLIEAVCQHGTVKITQVSWEESHDVR